MKQIFLFLMLSIGILSISYAQNANIDRARALEIYSNIISFRTASGQGKVPEMASYLAAQLNQAGFSDNNIHILPVNETAALVVRYQGDGSSNKKPILFLAHMDVVDATPDEWDHEPFTLSQDETFFLGRGTSDNKYGVMNESHPKFYPFKTSGLCSKP